MTPRNDTRLFVLVPREDREDAQRIVNEAFKELGEHFVNFDPEWSNEGGHTHTHYAAELAIPSEVVTRFSLAIVYRELYPEPLPDSGVKEVFRGGDTFIARLGPEGRCIALLFAHKIKQEGRWVVLHDRREVMRDFGVKPYEPIPAI
jgi:hypothetical protein